MTPVRYVDFLRNPDQTPDDRRDREDWLRIGESTEEQARLDIEAGNVPAGVLFTWRRPGIWQVLADGKIGRYA